MRASKFSRTEVNRWKGQTGKSQSMNGDTWTPVQTVTEPTCADRAMMTQNEKDVRDMRTVLEARSEHEGSRLSQSKGWSCHCQCWAIWCMCVCVCRAASGFQKTFGSTSPLMWLNRLWAFPHWRHTDVSRNFFCYRAMMNWRLDLDWNRVLARSEVDNARLASRKK